MTTLEFEKVTTFYVLFPGSSDEELENISKSSAEKEREQEQNKLLKQLLQNCPSADNPRKSDSSIVCFIFSYLNYSKRNCIYYV